MAQSPEDNLKNKIERVEKRRSNMKNCKILIISSMHTWATESSGIGKGTGGIPTTDNIPETTEIFGFPTDNISETTIQNINLTFKAPNKDNSID